MAFMGDESMKRTRKERRGGAWKTYLLALAVLLAWPAVLIFLVLFAAAVKAEHDEHGDINDPYDGAVDWGKK